jgi:hypothetical protein
MLPMVSDARVAKNCLANIITIMMGYSKSCFSFYNTSAYIFMGFFSPNHRRIFIFITGVMPEILGG